MSTSQPSRQSLSCSRGITACAVASSVFLAACSGAPSAQHAPAAVTGSGSRVVTGRAPAASGGFPAVVVLEPIGGGPEREQESVPRMDQEQETFIPSILLVRTGQPVSFLNHDDVLHNVRVRNDETKESSFNVAIPTGESFTYVFKTDGFYDVGCDVHPGMSASIFASTSPYAVTAEPSGAFNIPDVPDGPYNAVAYAGAERIAKEVSIGAGKALLDLTTP